MRWGIDKMVKVLWFSPYDILKAQEEGLKEIYGEDVEIEKVNRRFESKEHFLQFVKESGAKVVYAPLSPDVLQEFKNTEVGKGITWLMCEWGEVKDGVRKEDEIGFDPESDYARYAYGIGLHRRFLGFKEFLGYELKAKDLTKMREISEERKYLSREEYREKWRGIYRELNQAYRENKVYLRVSNGYIHVRMTKDCQMNDELRPLLKEMGFKFNKDYKEWYLKLDDRGEEVIKKIKERVRAGIENITVRILQKHREPEWKAKDIMKRLDGMKKAYRETIKEDLRKMEKPKEIPKEIPKERGIDVREFLGKTPADIEEENAKEYERFENEVKPLKEKLEELGEAYKEAPYRSLERRQIKRKIGEIKKEMEKISNEYQDRAYEEGVKIREGLENMLRERYNEKGENAIDRVIDDLFIAMTDRAYLEKTWNMKNEEILNHILEEYEKEGEIEPKGMGMEMGEERGNGGEEMEMGA